MTSASLFDPAPCRIIGRIPIFFTTAASAAASLVTHAQTDAEAGVAVHLCNAYTIALSDGDPEYLRLLQPPGHNLADGRVLPVAARRLSSRRSPGLSSLRGADLVRETARLGVPHGVRHFFLGSTQEVLWELTNQVRRIDSNVQVVGSYAPPFTENHERYREHQLELLHATKPQIVWVGLGTPKQDRVVADLANAFPAIFIAVGAAFEYVAGERTEAPRSAQRLGLEWLYRLIKEPRRLWRRYLLGNLRFIWIATRR